jgi:hypothetical protein
MRVLYDAPLALARSLAGTLRLGVYIFLRVMYTSGAPRGISSRTPLHGVGQCIGVPEDAIADRLLVSTLAVVRAYADQTLMPRNVVFQTENAYLPDPFRSDEARGRSSRVDGIRCHSGPAVICAMPPWA